MQGTVVAVLRGGPSREHDLSLQSGHTILEHLPKDRFTARDIYIDRQGIWHERGIPTAPERVLPGTDVVVLGLHGEYGEDGEVQKVLERYGVPYTGSDPFGSYLAMHKLLSKERAQEQGVLTPRYFYAENVEEAGAVAHAANRAFMPPVVVKPVRWGSSVGVSLVHGFAPLYQAISNLLEEGAGGVLVEERIKGTEATAGVVEYLRGEELYALSTVEIVPPASQGYFSYEAKYSGTSREICPGRFPKAVTKELQRVARLMHQALGLRHYSRSDFIVSPKGIYYLETNTLPGMTGESLFQRPLEAIGVKFADFLTHLVDLAKGKKHESWMH